MVMKPIVVGAERRRRHWRRGDPCGRPAMTTMRSQCYHCPINDLIGATARVAPTYDGNIDDNDLVEGDIASVRCSLFFVLYRILHAFKQKTIRAPRAGPA